MNFFVDDWENRQNFCYMYGWKINNQNKCKVKAGQLGFKYLKPIYKVFRNSKSVLCNIVPRMNKIHILHLKTWVESVSSILP